MESLQDYYRILHNLVWYQSNTTSQFPTACLAPLFRPTSSLCCIYNTLWASHDPPLNYHAFSTMQLQPPDDGWYMNSSATFHMIHNLGYSLALI